jgi:CubicO group peptidase (beta-lactamase class C family)
MSNSVSIAAFDAKKIDEVFAAVDQCHLPGAAVAVAVDGVPVYRKGFGLANLELPVTLSPTMRMRIGSTTKHFTAFVFMLLCEDGLAGVDDEIGKYIPEIHEASRHVTMRQLMGHTSGLRDVVTISMLFHGTGRVLTDKDMLAYYETIDDVDFAPGTHWSYNNGGYMLLSIAIERITGESLAEVLRKRVFEPVGMYSTMLRPWDTDFVPNSATLHMVNAKGQYTRDIMGLEISGAGGMVSTMDDMLLWLKHMDAPVIGTAETWKTMKTPQLLARGSSTGYGHGLITSPYRGLETLSHAGGVMGGNAQMIKVPSVKLDIVVAANRADVSSPDLANKIIDVCVDGLEPVPDTAGGARHEGSYLSKRTARVVELSVMNDMQLVAIDGTPGMPMDPDDEGVLRRPEAMAFMRQHIVPSGKSIQLVDFGGVDVLEAIEPQPKAKLGAYAGTYVADAIHVQAVFSQEDEGPRLKTIGLYGSADFKLEPITDRIWKATIIGPMSVISYIITFDANGEGLDITANRLANVRFRRKA